MKDDLLFVGRLCVRFLSWETAAVEMDLDR